ncbi:DUF262 domain-containing protein [Candidatus Electronema sp. TJ]|uniref:DUF262 domain-containing protein n=1 Tax=Candidatus Electronema sp. TJ TaxID=3401573 RepID=UPI003AA886ED
MKRMLSLNESEEKIEIEFNDENLPVDGADDAVKNLIEEEKLLERSFDPTFINIIQRQDTLRNVIDRLKNDEIDMNTDFQREAGLWDAVKMSRLIESILIRFPLPSFYFDATNDDKWLVVDGLQRLSSIRKFIIENNPSEKLRLRSLEYLDIFTGKTYEDLPRTYQRRIDECSVTLFLIQPGTPDEVKFSIFRRVNTGGLTLNFQEIRNALTSQKLRNYLRELAGDTYMKKTIGAKTKRMQDQELVLRFLAFYANDYRQSKKNITVFLDEMMKKLEKMSQTELDNLAEIFRSSVKRSWDVFGDTAFEKITENGSGIRRNLKNSTLFEVWTVALARLSEEEMKTLEAKKAVLQEKHIQLMSEDDMYFQSITFSTQKKSFYQIRCDRVQKLIDEVLHA